MDGACAALADPAAELGAGQAQVVANDPQQRRAVIALKRNILGIDLERHHGSQPLPMQLIRCQ